MKILSILLMQSDDTSVSMYLIVERQRFVSLCFLMIILKFVFVILLCQIPLWGVVIGYILYIGKSHYNSVIIQYQYKLRTFSIISGIFTLLVSDHDEICQYNNVFLCIRYTL